MTFKTAVFYVLTILLTPAWVSVTYAEPTRKQNLVPMQAAATRQLSHDFFVSTVDVKPSRNLNQPLTIRWNGSRADCEANFKRAVCETTATTEDIAADYDSVTCLGDGSQYVPKLMEIYDETPDKMRASLCTLSRIFISDAITSIAFATALTDRFGNNVGGYIGMRKQTYIGEPSAHDIVSWKEQLAFGGSRTFLSNDPKLVQITYDLKMSTLKSDGIFYVLTHELGHLIDFKNEVNSRWGSDTDWSELSWAAFSGRPLSNATFYLRDDFCFYNCASHLDPADAKAIYTSLQKSGFLSTYAASNAFEDFAEFWAWHLLRLYKNPHYTIEVPGEGVFEMDPIFTDNPLIKAKIDFIDKLWMSPALKVAN